MQVSRCYQKQRLGQTKDAGKSSTLFFDQFHASPVSEKQEEKPKTKNTHIHILRKKETERSQIHNEREISSMPGSSK